MGRPALLLSFDFEDWHQLVHRRLGLEDWDRPGPAFERQMHAVFRLLEELGAGATFFLVGMTARNYPGIVREIVDRGYGVASHGYAHTPVHSQTPEEFRQDVEASIDVIGELTGTRPIGYRAPVFSITRGTPWAYDVLAELGFRYDSSQHDSPRIPDRIHPVPETPYRLDLPAGKSILELPIPVLRAAGRAIPFAGGAYWRVLPAPVLVRALRSVARSNPWPLVYFHPYEFDPLPLRADLPAGLGGRRRLFAATKSALRNPGRRLVAARIRKVAEHFQLVSYEEAYGEIDERYGSSTRALSPEGVLV